MHHLTLTAMRMATPKMHFLVVCGGHAFRAKRLSALSAGHLFFVSISTTPFLLFAQSSLLTSAKISKGNDTKEKADAGDDNASKDTNDATEQTSNAATTDSKTTKSAKSQLVFLTPSEVKLAAETLMTLSQNKVERTTGKAKTKTTKTI